MQRVYRSLEGGILRWRRALRSLLVRVLTGLLLLCVVHGDNLTLDHRRQQHRHHLHSHPCQRRAQDPRSTLCSASWSESNECRCSYCRPSPSPCLCDLPPGTCWGRCTARCSTVNGWQEKTWQRSTAHERCETQSPWRHSLEQNGSSNSEFKRWRKMWRGQIEDWRHKMEDRRTEDIV